MTTASAVPASVTMTFDEWEAKYQPITNPFDENEGIRLETYGRDLEFVKKQPAEKIWTIVDADDQLFIVNGFHIVNRFSYVITKVPCDAGFIEVRYDD